MGKSRSVTIMIAYLLRQNPEHTVSSALELIRKSRPMAEPNYGFMAQLELYREMECPRDIDAQPKYQRWLYQREVDLALAAGMAPDRVRFEDEETQDEKENEGKEIELRCKKCRYVLLLPFLICHCTFPFVSFILLSCPLDLARTIHVISYTPSRSQLYTLSRRTLATTTYLVTHLPIPLKTTLASQTGPISSLPSTLPPASLHSACTHHFLHPLSWMRPELEQGILAGRLECPNTKCGAQLGRYAWQGMRCSCGVWVCPAFSLQKGRVDEVSKKNEGRVNQVVGRDGFRVADVGTNGTGGAGIRLPPGMKGKENL